MVPPPAMCPQGPSLRVLVEAPRPLLPGQGVGRQSSPPPGEASSAGGQVGSAGHPDQASCVPSCACHMSPAPNTVPGTPESPRVLSKQRPAPSPTRSHLCGLSGLIPTTTSHPHEHARRPVVQDLPDVFYLPARPGHMGSAHPVCFIHGCTPGRPAGPGSEEGGGPGERTTL